MGRSEELAKLSVGLELDGQSFARELSNIKKSAKNLSKDFDVASKSIEQADNKMEAMAQALQKGNKAFDATEKKLQKQNEQYDSLYKKTEKQRQKYDELSNELKNAEKALTDMANKGDKSSESYKKQEKSVNDLKKALNNQAELVQKNSHKLQQYSTDIDKTSNDLNKLKTSLNDLETSMMSLDDGTDSLSGFKQIASDAGADLSLLELGAKSAAIAVAAIFAKQVYDGAISYDNAITDLRISLGLTEESAKSLLDTINNITDGGYSIEGITESVKYLEQRFNLTSKETEELAQSMDLLNKFGYESADVTRFMTSAVNDWGMNHSEALDMIMAGEQAGLNISKDWLDTLVEYTPILSTLGVSGKEAFALIDEAVNATGMNTDQAADMVKEFFLSLTDGSTTSKDAFKDLGIDIDELKKKIDNGSISSVDAMQQVMKAIMNVGDETERARLLQEIFKGTVEYGSEGVVQAWANMKDSVVDTAGAMDGAKSAYENSYQAMQQDLSNEWIELKQEIGSGVIPMLTKAADTTTKVLKTLKLAPDGFKATMTQMGNDIGNILDGAYGKVLEFTMNIGEAQAKVADFFGKDDKASELRKEMDAIDKKHQEVVNRIRERKEENERLNKEHSQKLEEIWNDTKLDVDTEPAKQKTVELTKSYNDMPKEVQTILKADDNESKAKALEVYNLYEQLPPEVQTIIKVDNYKALEGASTVEEILKNIPTEKLTSILTNINNSGSMTPEQLQAILDVLPEEERVKIETDVQGKEQVEQTKKDIDNIPKEAKSKVSIDTGDSIPKTQNVKKEVDSVNGKVSMATFKAETAQASKNVTGLKKNISDYDAKNTGKTKITKFNTITAQASKNVTGLANNVSSFVSRFAKTFTTTFNVVTKYSTQGSPTSHSSGAKPGKPKERSVGTLESTPMPMGEDVSTQSLTRDANIPQPSNEQPVVQSRLSLNPSSVLSGVDYNVNLLEDLENQLKKVNNQLDILDKKAVNALGQEKIDYLNKQNALYKQQQELQHNIAENLRVQQNELRYYLSQQGYGFNSDGIVFNYQNAILDLEKQLQSLKNVEGDKNETRIKDLERIKKYLEEYMDITLDKIPSAQEEWYKLQNCINDNVETVKELQNKLKYFDEEVYIDKYSNELGHINKELGILDKKLNSIKGTDKVEGLQQKIGLLKKQQEELHNLANSYRSAQSQLKNYLSTQGFLFDSSGKVSNYDHLNSFINSNNLEEVKKALEEYIDLTNNEIPKLSEKWWEVEDAIKDTLKEQLDVIKDVEDEITKVYEKQVKDRINLIEKELDKRLDAINKEKEAYNDARDEVDYQNKYDDQLKKVQDLQKEYDRLSGDNSLGSKKKLQELLKQIEEEQKKLEEIVSDRIHDNVNDMFDKESDRLTENAEDAIKDLEDKFSDSKIAELVAQALGSGVFTDIEGNVSSLEDALINFAEETGDLFGVLGGIIEDELVENLEQALDIFKDLDSILNNLGISQMRGFSIPNVDYSSSRYNPSSTSNISNTTNNSTNSQKFEFNSPLINIEGNVDKSVMEDLKGFEKNIVNKVCKEIMSKVDGR